MSELLIPCTVVNTFYLIKMSFKYLFQSDIGAKLTKYPPFTTLLTSDTYFLTLFYFISAYASCFEIGGHTILSINRYSVIKNAKINHASWTRKVKWTFYILLFVAPMLFTIFRLFAPVKFGCAGGFCFVNFVDPTASNVILYLIALIKLCFQIASYLSLGYYTINFIISLYATVRSCINYRMLNKSMNEIKVTEKNELKLISKFTSINMFNLTFAVHSCIMFLLLVARYAYQITILISNFTKLSSVINIAQLILPIIGSFYSLIASPMLLILSKQVRYDFFQFYRRKSKVFWDFAHSGDFQVY